MTKNTAICPIPWNHLAIQQNGDFRICCQHIYPPYGKLTNGNVTANVNNVTISDVRNSPEIKDLRVNMIKGIHDSLCGLCYQDEDVGIKSKRQKMLKLYNDDFINKT